MLRVSIIRVSILFIIEASRLYSRYRDSETRGIASKQVLSQF
ncbi:MAG: hypothetical protein VSS75_002835 [Candidatus Parabeggiatoa sp.]|nr:hypothetical protein [Candidatus Parabeggiatoa sp.]